MVACGCLVESVNCVLITSMKILFDRIVLIAFDLPFDFVVKFLIILNLKILNVKSNSISHNRHHNKKKSAIRSCP